MALSLQSLQRENFSPIKIPNPVDRQRTIADFQAAQQQSTLRGQQIQQNEGELAAQKQAMQKATAVHETLVRHKGDFAAALPELKTIDPQFGLAIEKELQGIATSKATTDLNERKFREDQLKSGSEALDRRLTREAKAESDRYQNVPAGATVFDQMTKRGIFTAPETNKSSAQPAAVVQEYNFYAEQERAAGREPLSFDKYQERDSNRRAVRPAPPVVLNYGGAPQLVDRGTGVATPIKDAGGTALPAAPTADMRNKQAARALVGRSIKAVEDLSKKVITETQSIVQRAKATGMAIDAALSDHPEYKTYQASRMALAGNLAVGQQGSRPSDADIKAIWLPLVPDVFSDTAASAKMKWDMIHTQSGETPASASPASSRPRASDGKGNFVEWDGTAWVPAK